MSAPGPVVTPRLNRLLAESCPLRLREHAHELGVQALLLRAQADQAASPGRQALLGDLAQAAGQASRAAYGLAREAWGHTPMMSERRRLGLDTPSEVHLRGEGRHAELLGRLTDEAWATLPLEKDHFDRVMVLGEELWLGFPDTHGEGLYYRVA